MESTDFSETLSCSRTRSCMAGLLTVAPSAPLSPPPGVASRSLSPHRPAPPAVRTGRDVAGPDRPPPTSTASAPRPSLSLFVCLSPPPPSPPFSGSVSHRKKICYKMIGTRFAHLRVMRVCPLSRVPALSLSRVPALSRTYHFPTLDS